MSLSVQDTRLLQRSLFFLPRTYGHFGDPFHFYLGFLAPLALSDYQKTNRSTDRLKRKVVVPSAGDESLNLWIQHFDPTGSLWILDSGHYLSELVRRSQLLVRMRGRSPIIYGPRNWDSLAAISSARYSRNLNKLREVAWTLGETRSSEAKKNQVTIVIRTGSEGDEKATKGLVRRIPNLTSLEGDLAKEGYTVVTLDPASAPPREVIQTLRETQILVGQYGAGLTHQIWMPSGSRVVEISASEPMPFNESIYEGLAGAAGHSYVRAEIQQSWGDPVRSVELISALRET